MEYIVKVIILLFMYWFIYIREINLLRQILLEKYDIESTYYQRNKNQYRIRVPNKHVLKFQNIVRDYIHLNMAYRVGLS